MPSSISPRGASCRSSGAIIHHASSDGGTSSLLLLHGRCVHLYYAAAHHRAGGRGCARHTVLSQPPYQYTEFWASKQMPSFLLNILALTRVIAAMLFRSSLSSADVTSTLLLAVALLIFLLAAGIHHAVVHHYRLTDGNWLMGFFAALPFYLSREIRDREKLGHWDWAGLWWPTAGLIVVLAVLEIGSALWRRRTKATSTNARSSEADAAPAAGRT